MRRDVQKDADRAAGVVAGFALLVGAIGFEVVAVWLLATADGGLDLVGAVMAYVAAANCSAEGLALRFFAYGRVVQTSMLRAGWLLGLALPIFGPLVSLLIAVRPLGGIGQHGTPGSMEAERRRAAATALERRRHQQEVGAELNAIVDALKDRDKSVRIAAIDALRGDTSPEAVRILSQSRDNTMFDVRMRAVEGLGRISKDYSDKMAAVRAQLETSADDSRLHLQLADLCLTYGRLGIEDEHMTRGFYDRSVRHAQVARKLGAGRQAALVLAGALRELKDYEGVEGVYRDLLRQDESDPDALLGIAESQFLRRDLKALRDTCRWVLQQAGNKLDSTKIQTLRFWLGKG